MSNRLTFSLASLILIFALAAMPAMAATIEATWDGTSNWSVTVKTTGGTDIGVFPIAITDPAASEGSDVAPNPSNGNVTATVPAIAGQRVAVRVVVTSGDDAGNYQRVTLPASAALSETTLVLIPKLKKLTTGMYYVNFASPTATVTFDFAAAGTSNGAPSALLHRSDVTLSADSSFQVVSVSGTNTVMVRSTSAVNALSNIVTVSLNGRYASPAATPAEGQATAIFDNLPPRVMRTPPLRATAVPGNFIPSDGIWNERFQVIFSVADDITDDDGDEPPNSSKSDTPTVTASPAGMVTVGTVGIANQTDVEGTEYGVTITPLATRPTTAGQEVTITIAPVDKAGNSGTDATLKVKLTAGSGTPPPADAEFRLAEPGSGNIGKGGAITLTFSKNPGDVTASVGTITTVTDMPTKRTLTLPSDQAVGSVSITLTWGSTPTKQTLTYTVTVPPVAKDGDPQEFIFPKKSYTVIVHDDGHSGLPTGLTPRKWKDMPDLENLLYTGGTIALTGANENFDHDGESDTAERKPAARDLIITEVMWARNLAKVGTGAVNDHQWIEVYNNLDVDVTAKISAKQGQPALEAGIGEVLLDRLSNVVGQRWQLTGLGQNGSDDGTAGAAKVDFISMFRKERGKDGHTKGHWSQSTETYLAHHKGTPGAKERGQVGERKATELAVGPVIFNEVANKTSGTYEWFELRNKSDGEQNLKNRRISIVTAVGTDTWLFDFGDADVKIPKADSMNPATGVLLCVFTDPSGDSDHPLATGWNIDKGAADQVPGVNAESPRYIVLNDHGKRKYNEAALSDSEGQGLPNNGQFILILRTRAHGDDVGKPSNIWDIAGAHNALTVSADLAGFTNLWPLEGNVRHANRDRNRFHKDTVHQRRNANIWGTDSSGNDEGGNKADQVAFQDVGWSGIGYKRNTTPGNVNGGTPGYDNGASKSADAAALDPIVISEIMFDSSRNLPQWIEIQNMSHTTGVNLTNWALDIVNHHSDGKEGEFTDAPLSTRIKIWEKDNPNGAFQIPPRQTALIVSNAGRDQTRLPQGRIINLRLGRGPKLLNPNGFAITLVAKANEGDANKHQMGDSVGNLGAVPEGSRRTDARSFEKLAWTLPSGTNANGDRVSIARNTVMQNATKAGQWVSSEDDTRLARMRDIQYYGHSGDLGSPGHTLGAALPVSLSKFRPERLDDGSIVVRWITESELNNAGFNILRSDARDGQFTKLNEQMIKGQGTTSERTVYDFVDKTAKPNVVYYYQIQDVSLDGDVVTLRTSRLKGHISAAGKATTTWGELKALQ